MNISREQKMDLKGENVKFSLCYEKKKSILSITASDLISFECMNYEFSKKKKKNEISYPSSFLSH